MEFRRFDLDGPVEIIPRKVEDERGYFSEIFRVDTFSKQVSITHFVQENQSLSARIGTIRGIHFQSKPFAQGKLIRCVTGSLFDVAVDLRSNSAAFGRSIAVMLSADANNQLWIPAGFGHAFCTLEPNTVISYRVTDYYSPENDKGVAWDDPDIGIDWPAIADPQTLSAKDRRQPRLAELPPYFTLGDS